MTMYDYITYYADNNQNIALQDSKGCLSYKEFKSCINNCISYFFYEVCKPKSVVILNTKQRRKWVVSFFSLLSLDCIIVPVPDEVTSNELIKIQEETGAVATISDSDLELQYMNTVYGDSIIPYQSEGNGGIYHLTSGSTGIRKYCKRTETGLVAEGLRYKHTLRIQKEDKILAVAPIYHSFSLGAACFAALVSGATLCVTERFVPREVLWTAYRGQVTIMILVPAMARLLYKTRTSAEVNLSSVRLVLAGAGVITEETFAGFRNKFGINLSSNYGSTETGGIITRVGGDSCSSIGKPMITTEIKIVDDITESSLCRTTLTEGELWVKAEGMFTGYLNELKPPFDAEGYMPMGDYVRMDETGNIYFWDEKKQSLTLVAKSKPA